VAYIERKEKYKAERILGLETVRLVTKRDRLRWFVHVECKDTVDWVKHCMSIETEGTSQEG